MSALKAYDEVIDFIAAANLGWWYRGGFSAW
jgi:hypothetical protein